MDGSRGVRAAGTDGNDYQHRQKIDNRYEKLASAKAFIASTGQITLGAGLYSFLGSFIDPNVVGIDFGILPPIVLALITLSIWGLAKSVSSSVVDKDVVAFHKLLSGMMLITSFAVLGSIAAELLLNQNFSSWLMYITIPVYLFTALISRRSSQADDEIIEALDSKKGSSQQKKK